MAGFKVGQGGIKGFNPGFKGNKVSTPQKKKLSAPENEKLLAPRNKKKLTETTHKQTGAIGHSKPSTNEKAIRDINKLNVTAPPGLKLHSKDAFEQKKPLNPLTARLNTFKGITQHKQQDVAPQHQNSTQRMTGDNQVIIDGKVQK